MRELRARATCAVYISFKRVDQASVALMEVDERVVVIVEAQG
jgi:hypothetical protein